MRLACGLSVEPTIHKLKTVFSNQNAKNRSTRVSVRAARLFSPSPTGMDVSPIKIVLLRIPSLVFGGRVMGTLKVCWYGRRQTTTKT